MLVTGLLAAILALGSAFVSDVVANARTAEAYRVVAIGSLCVALATLVVALTSPESLRTRTHSHGFALVGIALLLTPGVLVGLGWFLVWVVVPSVVLVPLVIGWGASEVKAPEQLKHLH